MNSDEMHIQNALAYEKITEGERKKNAGKYALIYQGDVVEYFEKNRDAITEGVRRFNLGRFSVMRVIVGSDYLGVNLY